MTIEDRSGGTVTVLLSDNEDVAQMRGYYLGPDVCGILSPESDYQGCNDLTLTGRHWQQHWMLSANRYVNPWALLHQWHISSLV